MSINVLMQCQPVTNIEEIKSVLREPPSWADRVLPLEKRSNDVVRNVLSDCHSVENSFVARNRVDSRLVPKTLICHDYNGGYLEDRFVYEDGENVRGDGYTFYNWAQIDYFVYFSHNFITIPPLSWINIAHKNGVKILGTLITESEDGAKICDEIFKDLDAMTDFAQDLSELTTVFGIDGWLLNIENHIENPKILIEFTKLFTNLIHNYGEGVVIWYDSVTKDGKLKWQNELNDNNRCFFDNCDGIFLNYGWVMESLLKTVENAGHRQLDVFVGIDVFGRNMFGGGKFNTFRAAELISKVNLSMAIFAPGWTHEKIDKSLTTSLFDDFLNRDYAFWYSLWPYLYTHPVSDYFETDFYIGLDKECYNLFSQKQQLSKFLYPEKTDAVPEFNTITALNEICTCMQQSCLNSKNGCLLTKQNLDKNYKCVHRLFVCDLKIRGTNMVYVVTKNTSEEVSKLSIALLTCSKSKSIRKIQLLSEVKNDLVNNWSLMQVNPRKTNVRTDSEIRNIHAKYKILQEDGAHLSMYEFHTSPCTILEIGATIEMGQSIYICAFGIKRLFDGVL